MILLLQCDMLAFQAFLRVATRVSCYVRLFASCTTHLVSLQLKAILQHAYLVDMPLQNQLRGKKGGMSGALRA